MTEEITLMNIDEKYQPPIRTAIQAALLLSPAGVMVPILDTGGMAGIWTSMIVSIADKSGHQMTPEIAAKLAAAIVSSVVAYRLAAKVMISAIRIVPGLGRPASIAINTALNTYFTYRLGLVMIKQFDQPEFDVDNILEFSTEMVQAIIKKPTAEEFREIRDLIA